ncbi:MAG: hypothetical protein WDO13_10755 [Verrucomicrobiota bacterium]
MNDEPAPQDPAPPPRDAAPPPPAPVPDKPVRMRRVNWHRVRVYFWSIMIMGAMWFGAIMVDIKLHPGRIINRLLAELPYPSRIGGARWINRRSLEIRNVRIGDFITADKVIVTASPLGLWRHHVTRLEIIGGQLLTKQFSDAMDKSGPGSGGLGWVIGRLEIDRSKVVLNNLPLGIVLPINLGTQQPIVLTHLQLDNLDAGPDMGVEQTVQTDAISAGNFLYADSLIVSASPRELLHRQVGRVRIIGGQLLTQEFNDALEKGPQSPPAPAKGAPPTPASSDWLIRRLEISRGTVMLDSLIPDTTIPIGLGRRRPIVLTNLHIGRPDASPEMMEERNVEIGGVFVASPLDPLAPVFGLPLTRIRFTYSELWRHQIRRIEMIRPTLFLGEDLFWLTKHLKAEARQPKPSMGVDAPWQVGRFAVYYGRLAVNAFGQPVATLPFFFDTKVDNIRLDQLDQISARSTVAIENLTADYPDYKIRVKNLHGQLYFSWPPTDKNANNVVNAIKIDEISWNNIPAKDVSTTVTFDPQGVTGDLKGTCEGGNFSGSFHFSYGNGFGWDAHFLADKVNSQPIAQQLVGKYCDMTGLLDAKVSVYGQATKIQRCQGLLDMPNAGMLHFKSMDELVKRLPPGTAALKQQLLQLAVQTFETYPYDTGRLNLNYTPGKGVGTFDLTGPLGARHFEVHFHPYNLSE